jgi:hypothetical protein
LFLHGNPQLGLPAEVLGPTWLDVYQHRKLRFENLGPEWDDLRQRGLPADPRAILQYYFRKQVDLLP